MIHETAIIDPAAKLGANVEVGAYSIIGADVEIGDDTVIGSHVVIKGPTRIGKENHIYQFSSIGEAPQDKKYAGEPTLLEIGDRNTIREFCTFNRGTVQDIGTTKLGNDNWVMAYVHIAHDCVIGNNCILANNAALAGHVIVGDWVICGGYSKIHQFCKIGDHAFLGFDSGLHQDVPPYVTVAQNPAKPYGINSEGLRRRGFTSEQIRNIKKAYRILYRSNLKLDEAKSQLAELVEADGEVAVLLEFLEQSSRGIVR
jgi:UDP-N-acetylglucosamine acyltransferase